MDKVCKLAKAEWQGKERFGITISVHEVDGVKKYGFAFGEPTQWVAFLTESPEFVYEPEEVDKAYKSARVYWTHELDSLEQRAALHLGIDDEEELARLIENAKEWVAKFK